MQSCILLPSFFCQLKTLRDRVRGFEFESQSGMSFQTTNDTKRKKVARDSDAGTPLRAPPHRAHAHAQRSGARARNRLRSLRLFRLPFDHELPKPDHHQSPVTRNRLRARAPLSLSTSTKVVASAGVAILLREMMRTEAERSRACSGRNAQATF